MREGLVGILEQPHPKFAAIKRHHPHGVYSMSSKAGCLVWVEKDGMWSGAYERLKAEGGGEGTPAYSVQFMRA